MCVGLGYIEVRRKAKHLKECFYLFNYIGCSNKRLLPLSKILPTYVLIQNVIDKGLEFLVQAGSSTSFGSFIHYKMNKIIKINS